MDKRELCIKICPVVHSVGDTIMNDHRVYWSETLAEREASFGKPAGTWRVALLASIGLWGLIATAVMQLVGV